MGRFVNLFIKLLDVLSFCWRRCLDALWMAIVFLDGFQYICIFMLFVFRFFFRVKSRKLTLLFISISQVYRHIHALVIPLPELLIYPCKSSFNYQTKTCSCKQLQLNCISLYKCVNNDCQNKKD
jgi:hypothetical protein